MICMQTVLVLLGRLVFEAIGGYSSRGTIDVINCLLLACCVHLEDSAMVYHIHIGLI